MPDETPEDLGARIAQAKAARQKTIKQTETTPNTAINAGALALRYGAEFGACVFVGLGLGLIVDHFFNTAPWGLLILLAFGLAAGVLGVIRAYQQINAEIAARNTEPDKRTEG